MNATTSIRISAAAFAAAGLRMTDETADTIEAEIGPAGRVRTSMMGSHATIEVETDFLIDTTKALAKLGLLT